MEIGIFAKTFPRPTLAQTLDAVAGHGLRSVQFNFACVGLPTLPERIAPEVCERIRGEMEQRGLTMAAVSGTFNLIHPDPRQRQEGLRRLRELAAACVCLNTGIITLCTGSRDPEDMWRRHPENSSPAAWADLAASLETAVQIAEDADILIGIEPEVSNVVDSARRARRLLDEMRSPRLRIVMDAANLFPAGELPRMREILEEAFALLGDAIGLAHAKDLSRDGAAGGEAAGTGVLDYDRYLALLRQSGYTGALLLHGLREEQVAHAVTFLRGKM